MKLFSTNNINNVVSLKEAVLKGLPEDNGLYMPTSIPVLPQLFFEQIANLSLSEIAYKVTKNLFQGVIPDSELLKIINNSINFPAPLVNLVDNIYILELFHGPSLAFKDFGARFMAQLMGYFNQGEDQDLIVLVATSGDTGGAVAAGFYNTPGVKVIILYPRGRVSELQELQLTTWGSNITAIEIEGAFDDCQSLVKKAFLDEELSNKYRLTSANSINIARLIPQSFYYFEAYKQLILNHSVLSNPIFVVPSGNFGNLTAGLFAKSMGLPTNYFVAATNINDTVVNYLNTGVYSPKESVPTLSNAMDVGNPSNFSRIEALFKGEQPGSTWNNMEKKLKAYAFSDVDTIEMIKKANFEYSYKLDPHTAVGVLAAFQEQKTHSKETPLVVLGTAHPIKFINKTAKLYSEQVEQPNSVLSLYQKKSEKIGLSLSFDSFKYWLLDEFS